MPNAWEFTDAQCQYGSIFGPAKIRYRLESVAKVVSEDQDAVCLICGEKYREGMIMDTNIHQKDPFANTCRYYGIQLITFPTCANCGTTLISGDTDNPDFVKCDKRVSELIANAYSEHFKNKKEDKDG